MSGNPIQRAAARSVRLTFARRPRAALALDSADPTSEAGAQWSGTCPTSPRRPGSTC
jgi:hypothetical protein